MKISKIIFVLFVCTPLFLNASNIKKGYTEKGKASYYGKKFHGRLTANGEKFNMYALTAAHKSLPFNTLVRVTDIQTRKQILVRVNDRGPFIKGRTIDLSKGAARELDILEKGVADVQIEIIRLGTGEEEDLEEVVVVKEIKESKNINKTVKKVPVASGKTYSIWGKEKEAEGFGIQIGSYTSKRQMLTEGKKAYSRDLKDLYVQKIMLNGKLHYRILYLSRKDRESLNKALSRVKKMGYRRAFIRSHLIAE